MEDSEKIASSQNEEFQKQITQNEELLSNQSDEVLQMQKKVQVTQSGLERSRDELRSYKNRNEELVKELQATKKDEKGKIKIAEDNQ